MILTQSRETFWRSLDSHLTRLPIALGVGNLDGVNGQANC
jgi:hypothetical protein